MKINYRWKTDTRVADVFFCSSWNPSSWRNEKATFKEKLVEIATEKVNLLSNCVCVQTKIMHFWWLTIPNVWNLLKVETHMADHLFVAAAGEDGKLKLWEMSIRVTVPKFRPSNPPLPLPGILALGSYLLDPNQRIRPRRTDLWFTSLIPRLECVSCALFLGSEFWVPFTPNKKRNQEPELLSSVFSSEHSTWSLGLRRRLKRSKFLSFNRCRPQPISIIPKLLKNKPRLLKTFFTS